MKSKYTIEEQIAVKRALIGAFDLKEKKVTQSWLDELDITPNPDEPKHWDSLLYSKKHDVYINLKWFPRITIEPAHTTTYNIGIINYEKGMPVETILWYVNNILKEEDE